MEKKIGKSLLIFFLMLIATSVWAQKVDIELQPKNPVAGEIFKVVFRIQAEGQTAPSISFNPINIEVLGRDNLGVSTQTTYINGNLTSKREMLIGYEVVAAKEGNARLDEIRVEVDGKTLRPRDVRIRISNKPKASGDIFLVAIPSKTEAFVGESIMIDYYVYSKGSIKQREIRKFPELKGFLKRFLQKQERLERVVFNGQQYYRILMYSAQLFPNKAGNLSLDPMTGRIAYAAGGDPFSNFGFGFSRLKQKTIKSENVSIKVNKKPPYNGSGINTGLVGDHKFNFKINKQKFLVNEPIEITLDVTGPGALENMEAPVLFGNSAIENFESNANLNLSQDERASKTFKYTFLGKKEVSLDRKSLKFAYFEPSINGYKEVEITIPDIEIRGGAIAANSSFQKNDSSQQAIVSNTAKVALRDKTILAPIFETTLLVKSYYFLINIILGVLILILLSFSGFNLITFKIRNKKIKAYLDQMKKEGLSYNILFNIFQELSKNESNLERIIGSLKISDEAKKYFQELVSNVEKVDYSSQKGDKSLKYQDKYFNELLKI